MRVLWEKVQHRPIQFAGHLWPVLLQDMRDLGVSIYQIEIGDLVCFGLAETTEANECIEEVSPEHWRDVLSFMILFGVGASDIVEKVQEMKVQGHNKQASKYIIPLPFEHKPFKRSVKF